MRKDYGTRNKMMGGGMMKKRTMLKKGTKLKMVTNKKGERVPFYAADGVGKMKMGGRVKKMGGGMSKLNPGLRAFMKKKMGKK